MQKKKNMETRSKDVVMAQLKEMKAVPDLSKSKRSFSKTSLDELPDKPSNKRRSSKQFYQEQLEYK